MDIFFFYVNDQKNNKQDELQQSFHRLDRETGEICQMIVYAFIDDGCRIGERKKSMVFYTVAAA